mmetsp:Transcript_68303/g.154532  ORF Transcript_68303/g.154532 Transcript_68303/m.154532 type:complete len:361 (+) Transcript_68303:313-1395(+)|eukprot:CAMPEP_0172642474 /NCGR_PEP_ID=MMETSP1068-20121228/232362_1 /TAXON_ID=35684 /ORGANISM="Pseudopedinella elastica, Strain CCMP716" /LENGTH=360 /DNA_ID=CAMNT_0013456303 /DNA_START=235 /DNA_END=1317 /DNA_ORIENTATION=+
MGGLVRDIGGTTRRLFEGLHQVGAVFESYHIVILENDSKDQTRAALQRECASAGVSCDARQPGKCRKRTEGCCTCELLHLPEMGDSVQTTSMGQFHSSRIVRLTKMRNLLLEKVREVARSRGGFDWVLFFDGDMLTSGSKGFSPATVHALLGHPGLGEWDVVCGNQLVGDGMYRDAFALRFESLDEEVTDPAGMSPGDKLWFRGADLVPVRSCFSGLALYSGSALLGPPHSREPRSRLRPPPAADDTEGRLVGPKGRQGRSEGDSVDARGGRASAGLCRYEYEGEGVCEHVALHRCLAKQGFGRVAIYPPMALRMRQVRAETIYNPKYHETSVVNHETGGEHPDLARSECAPLRISHREN